MDLKEKYGLSRSTYEIAEIGNVFATKSTANSNVPRDYGTGELYTSVEAHTVTKIHFHPGITAKEIAKETGRTQSAVSQIVSKLISKNIIKAEKSPDDSRKNCLYLTEKGKELAIAHIEYDEKSMVDILEKIIQELGVAALENYIEIFHLLTYHESW